MGMGIRSAIGWEWDGNGNEVIEMGGNWYEKSVPAHLYCEVVRQCPVLQFQRSRWNHAAGSCVYRDSRCDIQPWARAEHLYCSTYIDSACHPSWDGKMSMSLWAEQ